jgi:hypothetical protein
MAKSVSARLKEAFEYSAIFHLEKTESGHELTDEELRDIKTFEALEKSLPDVPHELMEQTIQLLVLNRDAFENSLTATSSAVCDTFRPGTAAEFIDRLNADIRSEIETGKSDGREMAHSVREIQLAVVNRKQSEGRALTASSPNIAIVLK